MYPYASRDDGTPCRIASANMTDETGFAGANAARSRIQDLLYLYQSLLFAFRHQLEHDTNSTEGSSFKHLRSILSPYIGVSSSKIDDMAYCLGLYRTCLPNNLRIYSMNNLLLGPKRMPCIRSSSPLSSYWKCSWICCDCIPDTIDRKCCCRVHKLPSICGSH